MQKCILPSSQGKAPVVVSGVVLAALIGPRLYSPPDIALSDTASIVFTVLYIDIIIVCSLAKGG